MREPRDPARQATVDALGGHIASMDWIAPEPYAAGRAAHRPTRHPSLGYERPRWSAARTLVPPSVSWEHVRYDCTIDPPFRRGDCQSHGAAARTRRHSRGRFQLGEGRPLGDTLARRARSGDYQDRVARERARASALLDDAAGS